LGYLEELGYMSDGKSLSFVEINAWAQVTSVCLSPWEAIMIKELSNAFTYEITRKDINDPSPYIKE